MKYGRVLSILTVAAVLSLLAAVVPARPALAAPTVQLSPTSGAVGTRVTVTGTNFDSYKGDRVSVFFGAVEIVNSPVTVPDDGRFEAYFDVPDDTLPGETPISVRGPIGSVLAQASFMVVAPEIWPDSNRGAVGTTVVITARGFYADKIVVFYYKHDAVTTKLGTAVAGPTGECSYEFVVPPGPAGPHLVSAENAEGNRAQTTFEIVPHATVTPARGALDEIITVSGNGFAARAEVSVYVKTTPVAYISTDATGAFTGVFKVPTLGNGSYAMRIEDERSNRVLTQFEIVPGARLSVEGGPVGTEVTVSGNGFTAGGTLSVRYDGAEVGTMLVDEAGMFSLVFPVPASIGGQHTVVVISGAERAELVFTVESIPPPTPMRLLPESGAEVRPSADFTWEVVADPSAPVTYTVQVAGDEGFADVVLEKKGLTAAEYTPAGGERLGASKEGASYYWRVRAVDAASNESAWSSAGSFRVVPSFVMPGWAIYVLIGIGVVAAGLLVFRLWRRSRKYWD